MTEFYRATYYVTASHPVEKYRAKDHECTVTGEQLRNGSWVYRADADGYGMGHDKPTIEAAIRDLFFANGCTGCDWYKKQD